jgi:hypothetical protein
MYHIIIILDILARKILWGLRSNVGHFSDSTPSLIVPAITIALALVLFEAIPMKNMMSISTKQEEEHIMTVLASGGISTMLIEEAGEEKTRSRNVRDSSKNSKMKLIHQGFRMEEDLVKLLEKEANNRKISVSSLVNTLLRTHFTYQKYFEELGFIPVSKDFLRKVFSAILQNEAEEVGKSLGFSLANEYVSIFFPQLDSSTLIQFLEMWLGRFQSLRHRVEETASHGIKRHTFSVDHDINLNFSIALKVMLVGLIEPIIKTIVIFGDPTVSTVVFSFDI